MIIIVEGPDGSGKSTLASSLEQKLGCRKIYCPGGGNLGQTVRAMCKDPNSDLSRRQIAFLMAASWCGEIDEAKLEETCVMDRGWLSNVAYRQAEFQTLMETNGPATAISDAGLASRLAIAVADVLCQEIRSRSITLVLQVSPWVARERLAERAKSEPAKPDRWDGLGPAFSENLANAYTRMSERYRSTFGSKIYYVDASGDPADVLDQALELIRIASKGSLTH